MPTGGTSDYAPGNDPRRRAGQAVRLLRPARHAHSVHGHARRASTRCCNWRPPLAEQLTRTVYNIGAFNPSADEVRRSWPRSFRRRKSASKSTRSGKASSIAGPRTWTTPRRRNDWGLAPKYDLEARVWRVSDSDDQEAVFIGRPREPSGAEVPLGSRHLLSRAATISQSRDQVFRRSPQN